VPGQWLWVVRRETKPRDGLVFEQGLREAVQECVRGDLMFETGGEDDLEHLVASQRLQIGQPFLFPHRPDPALLMNVFQRFFHPGQQGQLEIIQVPMPQRHQ